MAESYLENQVNQTPPATLYETANQFQAPAYTPPESVSMQPASAYMTPETKVASQLKDLLSTDSPLLTLASTRAKEQANRLGLLSSSMAVGAGQREATKQMLPIATADAASAVQFGHQQQQAEAQNQLNLQQGLISGALSQQTQQGQAGLTGIQGDINAELQRQSAAQASGLSAQEYNQTLGVNAQTQEAQRILSAQEAEQNLNTQRTLQQAELDAKAKIAELDVSEKEKNSIVSNLSELQLRFMADTTSINLDPNMTPDAKETAISNLTNMYKANANSITAIYGTQLDWGNLAPIGSTPSPNNTSNTTASEASATPEDFTNRDQVPYPAPPGKEWFWNQLEIAGHNVGWNMRKI